MSSLINSAMSGINAAQAALSAVSNNISNNAVPGYCRQKVILSEATSTLKGNSYYGNGVTITGVKREYDELITGQLRRAIASGNAVRSQYHMISGIDNLLADSATSLSSQLQLFFSSMQNVVSYADSSAARQTLLSQAEALVNQFHSTDQSLRNRENEINAHTVSHVEQVNRYAKQIAYLNQQIRTLSNTGAGADPNDLLDQRDQRVNELNALIHVTLSLQEGSYNLSVGNGIRLVSSDTVTTLVAMPSSADPTRISVGYVDPLAGEVEIPEKQLTTGTLGGALTFRNEDLSQARNRLGQLALAFAGSVNAQHGKGVDTKGDKGEHFFSYGVPYIICNAKNTLGTISSVSAKLNDSAAVQASDYRFTFDGSKWKITRQSDNSKVMATLQGDPTRELTLSFEGMAVTVSGTPAAKDSFLVKPVSEVINTLSVAISDEAKVAAATEAGSPADNRNAQLLLDLQTAKRVGGNKSFSDAWAGLVSSIGNKTSALKSRDTTQEAVVTQLTARQQSVSGVSLEEEYCQLHAFQQYYQAMAQVFKADQSVFQTLMSIF